MAGCEVTRPLLLDLFCGAGGAGAGYFRAGFDVVGVDIKPMPRYPFAFVQQDALEFLADPLLLEPFAAVHASPPCQAYSVLRKVNPGTPYPDLVGRCRELLTVSGLPWVMENVQGAPMQNPLLLCGSMFNLGAGGRQLRRHRLFDSSHLLLALPCEHHGQALGVYGGGTTSRTGTDPGARGGYQGSASERREAMGIDWMTRAELNQAIPPAYTEFIGYQLLEVLAWA